MKVTNALDETLTIERHGATVMINSRSVDLLRDHVEEHIYFVSVGWVLRCLFAKPERKIRL